MILGERLLAFLGAGLVELLGQRRVAEREDAHGHQCRVLGRGLADAGGGDRNAGRHHRRGVERVLAAHRAGVDRHAEHRQRRMRRQRAGEMRGHAGDTDEHLDAVVARVAREGAGLVGGAVRAQHAHVEADADLLQRAEGAFEGGQIGVGTEQKSDRAVGRGHCVRRRWISA